MGPAVRRNQTIINLRDRPLYPRPSYSSRHLNPIEYPRPIRSYVVVTGALLYCAIYLVSGLCEPRPVSSAAPSHLERAKAVPVLTVPEALAPDMSSDDVRFAEADVDTRHANSAKTSEPVKMAAKAPPKKRKMHIVAKPKEEKQENSWQTFAFSFAGHRTQDGGF